MWQCATDLILKQWRTLWRKFQRKSRLIKDSPNCIVRIPERLTVQTDVARASSLDNKQRQAANLAQTTTKNKKGAVVVSMLRARHAKQRATQARINSQG